MKLQLVAPSVGVDVDGRAHVRLLNGTWKRSPDLDDGVAALGWACHECGAVTFELPMSRCGRCGCHSYSRIGRTAELRVATGSPA